MPFGKANSDMFALAVSVYEYIIMYVKIQNLPHRIKHFS